MTLTVGTFNLNNLFSRFNFGAEVRAIREGETGLAGDVDFVFVEPVTYTVRSFRGRLVDAKPDDERAAVASRIDAMDVDVLAVQEVEDIGTLRDFNNRYLSRPYRYQILVEGNDPRFIDLGVLSRYPIGGVTSWQHAHHPDEPFRPIFSRDLLEVEILNPTRRRRLLTLFNAHLKSHYVDWRDPDPDAARAANDRRRARQAETVARIVAARTRPDSSYVVLGDFNDPPDSPHLTLLTGDPELNLHDALTAPVETNPPKAERPPSTTPTFPAWTHRFKASGQPAVHELYDQIWLSPSLAGKQTGAWIHRRQGSVGGDGSDHDPAWVELDLG